MELSAFFCVIIAYLRLQGSLADYEANEKKLEWVFDIKNPVTTQNQTFKQDFLSGAHRYHYDISAVHNYEYKVQSSDDVTMGCFGWRSEAEKWFSYNYVADSHGHRYVRDITQPVDIYPTYDVHTTRTFLDNVPQCLAFTTDSSIKPINVFTNHRPELIKLHEDHIPHGSEQIHRVFEKPTPSTSSDRLSNRPYKVQSGFTSIPSSQRPKESTFGISTPDRSKEVAMSTPTHTISISDGSKVNIPNVISGITHVDRLTQPGVTSTSLGPRPKESVFGISTPDRSHEISTATHTNTISDGSKVDKSKVITGIAVGGGPRQPGVTSTPLSPLPKESTFVISTPDRSHEVSTPVHTIGITGGSKVDTSNVITGITHVDRPGQPGVTSTSLGPQPKESIFGINTPDRLHEVSTPIHTLSIPGGSKVDTSNVITGITHVDRPGQPGVTSTSLGPQPKESIFGISTPDRLHEVSTPIHTLSIPGGSKVDTSNVITGITHGNRPGQPGVTSTSLGPQPKESIFGISTPDRLHEVSTPIHTISTPGGSKVDTSTVITGITHGDRPGQPGVTSTSLGPQPKESTFGTSTPDRSHEVITPIHTGSISGESKVNIPDVFTGITHIDRPGQPGIISTPLSPRPKEPFFGISTPDRSHEVSTPIHSLSIPGGSKVATYNVITGITHGDRPGQPGVTSTSLGPQRKESIFGINTPDRLHEVSTPIHTLSIPGGSKVGTSNIITGIAHGDRPGQPGVTSTSLGPQPKESTFGTSTPDRSHEVSTPTHTGSISGDSKVNIPDVFTGITHIDRTGQPGIISTPLSPQPKEPISGISTPDRSHEESTSVHKVHKVSISGGSKVSTPDVFTGITHLDGAGQPGIIPTPLSPRPKEPVFGKIPQIYTQRPTVSIPAVFTGITNGDRPGQPGNIFGKIPQISTPRPTISTPDGSTVSKADVFTGMTHDDQPGHTENSHIASPGITLTPVSPSPTESIYGKFPQISTAIPSINIPDGSTVKIPNVITGVTSGDENRKIPYIPSHGGTPTAPSPLSSGSSVAQTPPYGVATPSTPGSQPLFVKSPPSTTLHHVSVPASKRPTEGTTSAFLRPHDSTGIGTSHTPLVDIPQGPNRVITYLPPPTTPVTRPATETPHYLTTPDAPGEYCMCSCPRI